MPPPTTLTWIIWLTAAAVGLAALTLAAWALRGDASRGRRRCPRCWYEIGDTATLQCPECGRTARREAALHRRRRRWRWAIVALLLLIASATAPMAERIHRLGWDGTPVTLRILAIPWVGLANERFQLSLNTAARAGLPPRQEQLLLSRLEHALRQTSDPTQRALAAVLAQDYWNNSDFPAERLSEALIAAAADHHMDVAYCAANALGMVRSGDATLVDEWMKLIESPHAEVRANAAAELGRHGEVAIAKAADAVLLRAIDDTDSRVVQQAAYAAARIRAPGSSQRIASLIASTQPAYRFSGVHAARRIGDDPAPLIPPLIALLEDSSTFERLSCPSALAEIGLPAAAPAIPALLRTLNDADPQMHRRSAAALGRIAPAGDPTVIAALVEALRRAPAGHEEEYLGALFRLGWTPSPEDRPRVETAAAASNTRIVVWARAILARTDGRLETMIDDLIERLDSADHWEMEAASEALAAIGAPARRAVPHLQRFCLSRREIDRSPDPAAAEIRDRAARQAIDLLNAPPPH